MAVQMGAKPSEKEDAKPAADRKMGANTNNPALLKNPKKEREWHQTLSDGCIISHHSIYPIVTVKSLGFLNSKIQVELNSHPDSSVVGSNVLVIHDHERYIDVSSYDNTPRHENITTVNATAAYEHP